MPHRAYVTVGDDQLRYVRCSACGLIYGPTENDFEAHGKAVDHSDLGGLPSGPEVPVSERGGDDPDVTLGVPGLSSIRLVQGRGDTK